MKLLEKIQELDLREYGVYADSIADKIAGKTHVEALVVALNNADTDGAALALLVNDFAKVCEGMKLLANLLDTNCIVLNIPAKAVGVYDIVKPLAEKNNIVVKTGIVNVRATSNCFVTHIVTCADIADINNCTYVDGIYVSVDGGDFGKLPKETTVASLVAKDVKGVQCGYRVLGADALDITLNNANPENGVIRSFTKKDCVVDFVDKHLVSCREQSCGKCVFCREGLLQLEAMQKDMTVGKGRMDEIDITKEIGEAMTYSTPCSMGQKSSVIALTAVDAFAGEYEEHIKKKKCAAEVCTAFQKVYVDPAVCDGCGECLNACKVDAIDGAKGYIHVVFNNWCTRCGDCISVCPKGAIHKTSGNVPKLPDRMMRPGRFK